MQKHSQDSLLDVSALVERLSVHNNDSADIQEINQGCIDGMNSLIQTLAQSEDQSSGKDDNDDSLTEPTTRQEENELNELISETVDNFLKIAIDSTELQMTTNELKLNVEISDYADHKTVQLTAYSVALIMFNILLIFQGSWNNFWLIFNVILLSVTTFSTVAAPIFHRSIAQYFRWLRNNLVITIFCTGFTLLNIFFR